MSADSVEVKSIPLTQGFSAIVDASDYQALSAFKWFANREGISVYACRKVRLESGKQTTIRMHRSILEAKGDQIVDHANHDGLDNRRVNLRICSYVENGRNKRPRRGASSQYLGVLWDKKRKMWRAMIEVAGRGKHQGFFDCEVSAARAYDAAARLYFGEFANPNFKDCVE